MKLDKINPQHILTEVAKHKVVLIWLLILVLLGFTLWQALQITDQQVDQAHLEELREEAEEASTALDLEEDLKDRIESLESGAIDIGLDGRGERDPFNP